MRNTISYLMLDISQHHQPGRAGPVFYLWPGQVQTWKVGPGRETSGGREGGGGGCEGTNTTSTTTTGTTGVAGREVVGSGTTLPPHHTRPASPPVLQWERCVMCYLSLTSLTVHHVRINTALSWPYYTTLSLIITFLISLSSYQINIDQ